MYIFLQLTLAGTDTGPMFELYSDADSYAIPFDTVSKDDLLSGYYTTAPAFTTTVKVQSISPPSLCDSFVLIVLGTTTTTTSTSTCPTYYELAGCDPSDYAFTTIAPTLGIGQQYVLPGSPNVFYTYTGSSITTCVVPSPYNALIQSTSNVGCP